MVIFKTDLASFEIRSICAKALHPFVKAKVVKMGHFNLNLKILNCLPRYLARIGLERCEEIAFETADCIFVIVVECFFMDSLRSAKDGDLASLYESTIDLEA